MAITNYSTEFFFGKTGMTDTQNPVNTDLFIVFIPSSVYMMYESQKLMRYFFIFIPVPQAGVNIAKLMPRKICCYLHICFLNAFSHL